LETACKELSFCGGSPKITFFGNLMSILYLLFKTCQPHTRYLTNLQKTWFVYITFTEYL
jgi:hypothetical protein